MIPKQEREELRRLCEKATAGPWKMMLGKIASGYKSMISLAPERSGDFVWRLRNDDLIGMSDADAEFIIASRQALPKLLDALDEADLPTPTETLGSANNATWKPHDERRRPTEMEKEFARLLVKDGRRKEAEEKWGFIWK